MLQMDVAPFRFARMQNKSAPAMRREPYSGGTTMRYPSRRSVLTQGGALLGVLATRASLAVADVVDDVAKSGVIKVGIFEDFPPFASLGSDMQIQGYDVDMANLIGKA